MKLSLSLRIFSIALLLSSCQINSNENGTLAGLSDSTSFTGLTGDSIKLVKTGSINFKVKDIEQSTKAVSILARSLGGMVFNQSLEYAESGRNELKISTDSLMVISVSMPQADITVRVPSENLEAFLYNVADLGYFTNSSKMSIDDKSLIYLENRLKQKNRAETLSQPTTRNDDSFTDLIKIEVKDEVIEQQIENRSIDADVNYSTVNLSLSQNPLVRKEIVANYVIADYQLPFSHRFRNSIKDGWEYFLAFILVLANLWVFVLISLTIFLSYWHLQQKRRLTGLNVRAK